MSTNTFEATARKKLLISASIATCSDWPRKDVATPLHIVREILGRLEQELNEGKTKIVDANKEGFRFLGFELKMNVESKGVPYGVESSPHPSKSSRRRG